VESLLLTLWEGSGLAQMTLGQAAMIGIALLLLYLAIGKKFEPLLLVPIGFGGACCISPIPPALKPVHFRSSFLWA